MASVVDLTQSTPTFVTPATTPSRLRRLGTVKFLGSLVIAGGLLLGISGAGTWLLVQNSLADERITVAADASRFAGQDVNGPLTAYSQTQIIQKHSLAASQGKTYAELDRTDPVRVTVMNGSFLRASLFTSVVSFGIAAMAMGLGLLFVLVGLSLRALDGKPTTA